MKKLTKGTIAAGVGVALLLGGGTTLAYWNDSVNMAGSTIQAGNLQLTQTSTPTWQIKHTSGELVAVPDITAVRIVPGDQLVYTGDYNITAQGQNLAFKADITSGSIAPSDPADENDVKLSQRLAQSAAFSIDGQPGATSTIKHESNTSATYPVQISVTLDWPFGTAGDADPMDNVAKLGSVSLSDFAVGVTQVDDTTTP